MRCAPPSFRHSAHVSVRLCHLTVRFADRTVWQMSAASDFIHSRSGSGLAIAPTSAICRGSQARTARRASVLAIVAAAGLLVACGGSGWQTHNTSCSGHEYTHYKPSCNADSVVSCEEECYDDSGDINYKACKCIPRDAGRD